MSSLLVTSSHVLNALNMGIVALAAISVGQLTYTVAAARTRSLSDDSILREGFQASTGEEHYNNRIFVLKLMDSMGMKADAETIARLEHRSHESILKEMISRKQGSDGAKVASAAPSSSGKDQELEGTGDDVEYREKYLPVSDSSVTAASASMQAPPALIDALAEIKKAVQRIEELWK